MFAVIFNKFRISKAALLDKEEIQNRRRVR